MWNHCMKEQNHKSDPSQKKSNVKTRMKFVHERKSKKLINKPISKPITFKAVTLSNIGSIDP